MLVLLWVGLLKFTPTEAEGIRPFVENSLFFSWLPNFLGTQGVSNLIGMIEVTTAMLMTTRRWSVIGSAMAVITFLFTLSFLLTTPKVVAPVFPGLSAFPGQFLTKDILLMGGSFW